MIKRGALLGSILALGALLFAGAINWFIVPGSHPHATQARMLGVVLQALAGLALAMWAWRRIRVESRHEEEHIRLQDTGRTV